MNESLLFLGLFIVGGLLAWWACIEDRDAPGWEPDEGSATESSATDRTSSAGRGTARSDFYFRESED